ncbi:hypothetical protein ACSHWB_45335 [Lentzea sp. HUAS TT2]|uniref:hypothetical protein n=1 Tax=Lentzea sp. HUAS TT2 TaxID=3447454 RepID=UPI003F70872B
MFDGIRVSRELGQVREQGVEVWIERDQVFPAMFTRGSRPPTLLTREKGFILPPRIPGILWAWLNTTTGRRVGYVTFERETAIDVLPMAQPVLEANLQRRYTQGEVPPY